MNIRSAILAAADHIEANPGELALYLPFLWPLADCHPAFFDRMDDLCGGTDWQYSPALCALTLRAYADYRYPISLDPAYVSWRDALEVEHGYARSGADG